MSASRVAMISLHTSPAEQPGSGDSGGMNVYLRSLAPSIARRGIAVDILTRRTGPGQGTVSLEDGVRLVHVPAGPPRPVPKERLASVIPAFVRATLARAAGEGLTYDLIHAHYWLSAVVGADLARAAGIPLVTSFHTLGRVKEQALGVGTELPERIRGERMAVGAAARVIVPTAAEASHLVALYGADPRRLRVVPPGVDLGAFRPGDGAAVRARLGVEGRKVILLAGRLQEAKGSDLAARIFAEVVRRRPGLDPVLLVVGGPSGAAPVRGLPALAGSAGVADRVLMHPPVPHRDMPSIYRAADVVILPSRTEAFGLVALEAQACGIPVVAAAVGGLPSLIRHGRTGVLVQGHDPADHAGAVIGVLERRTALGGGDRWAASWTWEATAERVIDAYLEVAPTAPRIPWPAGRVTA